MVIELYQCSSRIDFICHPWGDWREAKVSPKQFPTLERKLTSTEEENPCCCFFETWTVAFIKGCTLSRSKQRVTKICFSSALSRRSDWLLSCHTLQCWLVKSGNLDQNPDTSRLGNSMQCSVTCVDTFRVIFNCKLCSILSIKYQEVLEWVPFWLESAYCIEANTNPAEGEGGAAVWKVSHKESSGWTWWLFGKNMEVVVYFSSDNWQGQR